MASLPVLFPVNYVSMEVLMGYQNAAVAVTDTATLLCHVGAENGGVVVQNVGASQVFLGGQAVTATGALLGVALPTGQTMLLPTVGGSIHDLYAVCATGQTTTVAYLYPE